MEFIETPIEGLFVIQPKVFEDARGYFFESFSKKVFEEKGIQADFVQDNQSLSQPGVLRGLHFQHPPYAQGKLVRVLKGSVLDIVVDIRSNKESYGQSYSIILSEENRTMLWVPEGFAHGFNTLSKDTIFFYKCTNYYHKASEDGIIWNDEDLNLDWQIDAPILSEKDQALKSWKKFKSPF